MTGDELWAQGADVPMQPASTNKVLTTAAALLTLDRDARLTTRVLATASPGSWCSSAAVTRRCRRRRAGQDTWYRDAARIVDLADQVRRSGIAVTAVQVDVSAYSGPTMAPGWDPLDIDGGDIAPMESVMLDGGRTQPVTVESRRSRTPALDAGRALAVALGVDPATVTVLPSAARRAEEIASVQSPPLIAAVARHDERLRQRDGRVHRPRGRRRDWTGRRASTVRSAPCSARWTTRTSTPAERGCSTPAGCRSTTGSPPRPSTRWSTPRPATTSPSCGRWSTCCRSPAAAARCPTATSTPTPAAPPRATCAPRPAR